MMFREPPAVDEEAESSTPDTSTPIINSDVMLDGMGGENRDPGTEATEAETETTEKATPLIHSDDETLHEKKEEDGMVVRESLLQQAARPNPGHLKLPLLSSILTTRISMGRKMKMVVRESLLWTKKPNLQHMKLPLPSHHPRRRRDTPCEERRSRWFRNLSSF